jgi:transcriptional regulator with XRE-family HTH domain
MDSQEIESVQHIDGMGIILKEARKKAKLTQEELAIRVGSKRSYISRIERNASGIKLSTLVKIVEEGLGGKLNINIIL